MNKRRKITITQTEYEAIISAFATWHGIVYEEAEYNKTEYDTPIDTDTQKTNQALRRVIRKWHEAGR